MKITRSFIRRGTNTVKTDECPLFFVFFLVLPIVLRFIKFTVLIREGQKPYIRRLGKHKITRLSLFFFN